jgi:hypothetical protein
VTIEQIRATIEKSLPLRIPMFDPDTHPRVKMSALEDYILRTAHMRGELEEALHWAIEIGKQLRLDWDNHYGHQAQVIDAKRRTGAGPVWDGMQEAKALVESLERQIRRLGGSDYDAASRAYTLMSGS